MTFKDKDGNTIDHLRLKKKLDNLPLAKKYPDEPKNQYPIDLFGKLVNKLDSHKSALYKACQEAARWGKKKH